APSAAAVSLIPLKGNSGRRCSVSGGAGSAGLLGELGVDGHDHVVAHQKAARLQDGVPLQAEVLAVYLAFGGEGRLLVAPRIGGHAQHSGVQLYFLGHAPDGQIALHLVLVVAVLDNLLALKGDLGELVYFEEVGGAQVVVPVLDVGIYGCGLDGGLDAGRGQVLDIAGDGGVKLPEAPPDLGNKMADRELDLGMGWIDRPYRVRHGVNPPPGFTYER